MDFLILLEHTCFLIEFYERNFYKMSFKKLLKIGFKSLRDKTIYNTKNFYQNTKFK